MQPFRAHQLAHQAEEFPALSESTTYVRIGPLPTGQDVLTEAIEAEFPPGSRPLRRTTRLRATVRFPRSSRLERQTDERCSRATGRDSSR
jgi:hypothetical protein